MSTRGKVYTLLLAVALLATGVYLNSRYHWLGKTAVAQDSTQKNAGKNDKEATLVEVAAAVRGPISSHIQSSGNIRALRDVEVASLAEGIAGKILVEEGEFVRSGQPLCLLDDTQFKIRLDLAKAKLAQARLQLEKAKIRLEKASVSTENRKIEYERYKKAHSQGLVSEIDVAQRKYQYDELIQDGRVAESESREFIHRVEELEAEIAQAELELSRTTIKAPFDGYVTRRSVELGQRVRSLDPVFSLGAFSPLFTDVYVSERESHSVRPGQAVSLKLGSDGTEERPGHVERISPVVDQSTGTVKVTVELDGAAAGFRPGAFVRAAIRTDTRAGAVLVPKRALLEQDGSKFVFIANGESAKRAKVEVGYENDTLVEIRSGVSPGQKIVTAGQGSLKEGSKIKVARS
jgi:RND family efflux transporter MFP subunit